MSTRTIRYGIPDVLESGPTPHVELDVDPGTKPGGTSIPFHVEIFGITSYITPSIPAVKVPSHTHPRPTTSVPIRGPEPRHVNIGGMPLYSFTYSIIFDTNPFKFVFDHASSSSP